MVDQTYTVPRYTSGSSAGTLGGAASRMGISLSDLINANPQYRANPNLVQPGAVLRYGAPAATTTPPANTGGAGAGSGAGAPVAPASTPSLRYTTPYDTDSKSYYDNLKTSYTDADASGTRESIRASMQGAIDQINREEDTKRGNQVIANEHNTGRTRAILSSSGLIGSGRGNSKATDTETFNNGQLASIEAERSAKVNAILGNIDDRSSAKIEADRQAAQGNMEKKLNYEKTSVDAAKKDVVDLAKLATKGGTIDSNLDPKDVEEIMKDTGYSKLQLDSIWNGNLPDSAKPKTQEFTVQGKNGNAMLKRVSYDPNNPSAAATTNEYDLGLPYSDVAKGDIQKYGKDGLMLVYPNGTHKILAGSSDASGGGAGGQTITGADGKQMSVPTELSPYYKTSYSNIPYVDISSTTPSDKAKFAAIAAKAGIQPIMDAGTATKLSNIADSQSNLKAITDEITNQKLVGGGNGDNIRKGISNSISGFFGNGDVKSYNAWRTAIINNVQALAGGAGSGLRINKAEIDSALQNDLPVITGFHADSADSAAKKIANLTGQLNRWETQILGGGNHKTDVTKTADIGEDQVVNGVTYSKGADGLYYPKQ